MATTKPSVAHSFLIKIDIINSWLSLHRKLIIFCFFSFIFIIGLFVFSDYGLNWDEHAQRLIGLMNYNYLVHNSPELLTFHDRDYGVAFELPLLFIEKGLGLKDLRAIFLVRHLCTFLVFLASAIFFYSLGKIVFGNWKWALIATVCLILSPRIFGDAFHNSKDIPLMSMFIVSIYTLNNFLDKKTWTAAFFHALACALLLNLRIIGIIVPCFTAFFLLLDYIGKPTKQLPVLKIACQFLFYLAITSLILIALWPYLWENPVDNFASSFQNMKKFRWNGTMLYRGEFVRSTKLPWHYIPTWIMISTPKLYIFFFAGGIALIVYNFLKNPVAAFGIKQNHRDWILFAWFIGPLGAVILFGSVMYDAWRHMFFIYPAFILMAVRAMQWLWRKFIKIKNPGAASGSILLLSTIILMEFVSVTKFMFKFHPHQNVYFNKLTGESLGSMREHFELDYWGLSYRQALEYILENDKSNEIRVGVLNLPSLGTIDSPVIYNKEIIPEQDRKRLKYVGITEAFDYVLTNYRGHPNDYNEYKKIHSIKVNGAEIMGIYRPK